MLSTLVRLPQVRTAPRLHLEHRHLPVVVVDVAAGLVQPMRAGGVPSRSHLCAWPSPKAPKPAGCDGSAYVALMTSIAFTAKSSISRCAFSTVRERLRTRRTFPPRSAL